MFRKHQRPVDAHIKYAAASFNELRIRTQSLLTLCSQTDRFRLVASGGTVLDRNVHDQLLVLAPETISKFAESSNIWTENSQSSQN